MTILDLPRTAEATPERLAELDTLVQRTLPYLPGAYGNEAAAYLESLGYTRDEIRELAARTVLES